MSDYTVKYIIAVNSETAINGINSFKQAIGGLNRSAKSLENIRRQFVSIYDTMTAMSQKPMNFTITANTGEAIGQLEALEVKLNTVIGLFERLQGVAAVPVKGPSSSGKASKSTTTSQKNTSKANSATATSKNGKSKAAKAKGQKIASEKAFANFMSNGINPQTGLPYGLSNVANGRSGIYNKAYNHWKKLVKSHNYQPNVVGSVPQEFVNLRNWMQSPKTEQRNKHGRNRAERIADQRSKNSTYGGTPQWLKGEKVYRRWLNRTYPNAAPGEIERMMRGGRLSTIKMNPVPIRQPYSEALPSNKILKPQGLPTRLSSNGYYGQGGAVRTSGGYATRTARGTGWGGRFYKMFGPTPLPGNGGMALDMLKGMGIAYGIAGIGQLVSEIANQSVEYGNTMQTVENILKSHDNKGNFGSRFLGMTKVVRDVGMKTKYTVTEVADAAKFLAMAGLNVEEITGAIKPITDISLVGDTDLGSTADLVTNVMKSYQIPVERMSWAADVMTNTFTRSNVTLPEIAESMKYFGSLGKAALIPFEDTVAAIGVLGDAGLKGSTAGTSLRRISQNLTAPRGKKRNAAWARVGVDRFDAYGYLRPLADIFKDLRDKNLKLQDYMGLFDITASQAAVVLAQNADKIEWLSKENSQSGGIAARLAQKRTETMKGLWAQVKSVFIDKGVNAYTGVEGQIQNLMNKALDYMGANDTEGNTEKGDRFQSKMHDLAKTVMEFTNSIIDASKWFLYFYNQLAPFIKTWAKFQLMIWPVVKAITALASVFRVLFTVSLLTKAKTWASAFDIMTAATQRNTTGLLEYAAASRLVAESPAPVPGSIRYRGLKLKEQRYVPQSGGETKMSYNHETGQYESRTTPVVPAHWENTGASGWGKLKKKEWWKGVGKKVKTVGTPALGMAGAMVGGYKAIEQLTSDEGSGWVSAVYGAGAIASMMGPWGLAAGAILIAAGAAFEYAHNCNLAKEAAKELAEANKAWLVVDKDGRLINNKDSKQVKYWDLVISQQTTYGELLQTNIDKLKEQYGLIENPPIDENTISTGTFDELWNRFGNDSGDHQKEQQRKDINNAFKALGFELGDDWRFKMGAISRYIPESQRRGFLAAVSEAIGGVSTGEHFKSWMERISNAAKNGDDISNVLKDLNNSIPQYTMTELYDSMPKNEEQWKPYVSNPALLAKLPIIRYLIREAVKNRLSENGVSPQNIVQKQANWKAALRGERDIMTEYAEFHRYLGGGLGFTGASDLDTWEKATLPWNGFGYVDKNGKPLEYDELRTLLGTLRAEYDIATQMGLLDHLNDPGVKKYMDSLDMHSRQLSAYIINSYGSRSGIEEIWTPTNGNPYTFTNPYLRFMDQNWFMYNPKDDSKQLYTPILPPTVPTKPTTPTQSQLNAEAFQQWVPSAPNFGTATPREWSSQMVAQAQIKPEFHFHINGNLVNVENQSVNNPNDSDIGTLLSQVFKDATSAEGLQRIASGS